MHSCTLGSPVTGGYFCVLQGNAYQSGRASRQEPKYFKIILLIYLGSFEGRFSPSSSAVALLHVPGSLSAFRPAACQSSCALSFSFCSEHALNTSICLPAQLKIAQPSKWTPNGRCKLSHLVLCRRRSLQVVGQVGKRARRGLEAATRLLADGLSIDVTPRASQAKGAACSPPHVPRAQSRVRSQYA